MLSKLISLVSWLSGARDTNQHSKEEYEPAKLCSRLVSVVQDGRAKHQYGSNDSALVLLTRVTTALLGFATADFCSRSVQPRSGVTARLLLYVKMLKNITNERKEASSKIHRKIIKNPPALGRAFRTGGLRKKKRHPNFANFFAQGRWFTLLLPPPPGVPNSPPLKGYWFPSVLKRIPKSTSKNNPKQMQTNNPKRSQNGITNL